MTWKVKITARAGKSLKSLYSQAKQRLEKFIDQLEGLWRYQVGDYRLICDIQDNELIILVIDIGHRRNIYN